MRDLPPVCADLLASLPLPIVHNPTIAPSPHIGVQGWWPVWVVQSLIWRGLAQVENDRLVKSEVHNDR